MSRRTIPIVCLVLAVLTFGYVERGFIRDVWDAWGAPTLPVAARYEPRTSQTGSSGQGDAVTPFEPGYSTSQHFVLETAPTAKTPTADPLAFSGDLPREVNLDVPFTSQAPKSNWDMPYQEACEEASAIMVNYFYKGETGRINVDQAEKEILNVVAYEKKTLGFYEDTDAQQTAKFIEGLYGYKVVVKPLVSIDDIKRPLALGYPVIVPFAGKMLGNPNYRNGGPPYHMLVIRGYTPNFVITNDPGTRKGLGYTYSYDTIMKAAHDWNNGNVTTGSPVLMVVLPHE